MATVKLHFKSNKNPSTIYLRFTHGRDIQITATTSLKVNPKHWSSKKQKIKNVLDEPNKDTFNSRLEVLSKFIIDKFNEDYSTGKQINQNWLKINIAKCYNQPTGNNDHEIFFSAYTQDTIENAHLRILKRTGKPIKHRTVQRYITFLNRFKAYEKYIKERITFKDIDIKFHKKYLSHQLNKNKYSSNNIGKDITLIKMFCREAKLEDNIDVNPAVFSKKFFVPSPVETNDTYLDEDEIQKIFNFKTNNQRLDNVRDLFIIGLWTGQRVSDFMRISTKNIKHGMIEIKQMKTGAEVVIPLHDHVKYTLKKRDGKFPNKISNQKFNDYVKELCQLVGIDKMTKGAIMNPKTKRKEIGMYPKYKLISSHTCRRSLCSNLYGKIDTPTIMAISGHKKESTFLKYIKITPQEHAKKMQEYWRKRAEKSKEFELLKMKVV